MNSTGPDQPAASFPIPPSRPPKIPFGTWLMSNLMPVVFTIGIIVLVCIKLNVVDTAKVVFGLGLVIFIHELGHFAAAKWCGVYVKAFSIGFGKPIPGLSFKYGETDYKIGWIPLGGYVAMLGEPENAEEGDPEDHPRSLKHKTVGQRMLIISAGVIMNLILGFTCFLVVYSHGVEEKPPIVGHVDTGSPAWQAGLYSEVGFKQIGRNQNPGFDDLRPIVMSTHDGEKVPFAVMWPGRDTPEDLSIEPIREPEAMFPIIGVGPAPRLKLITSRRQKIEPFVVGSAAADAGGFKPGDSIIASTEKADGPVTAIPADKADPVGKPSFFDFYRRSRDQRSATMLIRVQRNDSEDTADIEVAPAKTLTAGMRMQMGRITALRTGGRAQTAECVSNTSVEKGLKAGKSDQKGSGDKITSVMVRRGDKLLVFSNKDDGKVPADLEKLAKVISPLDPLRLPYDLEEWADNPETKDFTVHLTTLRDTGTREESLVWKMEWDRATKYQREFLGSPNSPVSLTGLGLAYQVEGVVESVASGSPAAAAGMKEGDLIKAIRAKLPTGKEIKWQPIKPHQWGYIFSLVQGLETKTLQMQVESGGETVEREVTFEPDPTWFQNERGLLYQLDTRINKSEDLGQAAQMGINRTVRLIRVIYQNLYSMVFGRVSPFTMSGPLTIADISYKIAGENIWQFILFIGMININLAVVNFLPIPMLDGGHFIFLIYEKIRGKPAPESVQVIALYIGVAMVLTMMVFVLFLDVSRMFF